MASGLPLRRNRDPPQLRWRLGNVFGEAGCAIEEVQEADILSAVEFDPTGKYLATGDKGGRVVLFQKEDDGEEGQQVGDDLSSQFNNVEITSDSKVEGRSASEAGEREGRVNSSSPALYTFYAEFQSHEPEFDYLKSLEIEEKINKICWCPSYNDALYLLTTNDKTIKLWKIQEKLAQQAETFNVQQGRYGGRVPIRELKVPRLSEPEKTVAAVPRRLYANAHAYHINSISLNSDGMTFLSSDDLRINLWSLETTTCSFNIVDIKPSVMELLTEVITSAQFHPRHCHVFAYSSSRGSIKLGDMRERALCDKHAKAYEEADDGANRNYFSEITASVSDIQFSQDGLHLFSRDYLNVKVWDLRMENKPVHTIPVHDYLAPHLYNLYENDCIFDKFEVSSSPDGGHFVTGSYGDRFCVYDSAGKTESVMELGKVGPVVPSPHSSVTGRTPDPDTLDYNRKVLHCSWHPHADCVAVAGLNNLFIYNADRVGGHLPLPGSTGSAAPDSVYREEVGSDYHISADTAESAGDPFAAFKPSNTSINYSRRQNAVQNGDT